MTQTSRRDPSDALRRHKRFRTSEALLICAVVLLGGILEVRALKHHVASVSALVSPTPAESTSAPHVSGAAVYAALVAAVHSAQRERPPAPESPPVVPVTNDVPPINDVGPLEDLAPEDRVRRAREEPRDKAWAKATEEILTDDLTEKARTSTFRIHDVDCHSTLCIAELSWQSLRDARAEFKSVLGLPNGSNCHPMLLLPEDGMEEQPALGTMLLDCASQRARQANDVRMTTAAEVK
jgi:hypothetical protein